jgi:GntR family transcriptional regulator, transcriptional repressor for pyruvate dehydrogenase complex
MPIQSVEPRRLYRQIADQLRALIQSGEFDVGTRLPPERDLATQFGVSRPSVREALIALELEGMVEVRPGSGVHVVLRGGVDGVLRGGVTLGVGEPSSQAFGPFEIIRARQLIEGELAAVAAERMTPTQVLGLREAIVVMHDDMARGITPTRGDRLFHQRVVDAADNAPMQHIVMSLFDERNNPLFEQLGSHFENAPSWRIAVAEHEAVIDAIAARDGEVARAAMQAHLVNSHDRFAAVWPNASRGDQKPRNRQAIRLSKKRALDPQPMAVQAGKST